MKRYKTVEEFMANSGDWKESLILLRNILLDSDLEEKIKWGAPVYTINNKNVVGIGTFKSYTGLWFFQGVFLEDNEKKLINAQEGVTKGLRQWRFKTTEEIREQTTTIKAYVKEAISNQRASKEIKPTRKKAVVLPVELANRFANDTKLENSFKAFSMSKQIEFAEYISDAKREVTKIKRLDKIIPMILDRVGLNDKYR